MSAMAATAPIASQRRRILPRIPGRVYLFLSLYFGATWGTILVLANGVIPGAALWVASLAAFTVVPVLLILIRGGFGAAPGRAYRLFVLRPFWYLQLMLPLVAVAGMAGLATGSLFGAGLLLGRGLAATAALSLLALFAAGYAGSRRLVVRNVTAEIAKLPAGLDGTSIVQLSDLHIGPHLPAKKLERIVDTVRALSPDIIAVTGDLVDDHAEDTERYADALGALEAPLGVYVIAGNHDIYAGWNDVAYRLKKRLGSHVLVNQSRTVTRNGATLAIAGTGDPAAGHDAANGGVDISATLEHVPPGVPVLALAHNPALWPALAKRGVSLTLSGHTHWGQLALPRISWSMASPFLEHAMGGYSEANSLLYINPGTGYWGLPFRLGAWAEITQVTLRTAQVTSMTVGAVRDT